MRTLRARPRKVLARPVSSFQFVRYNVYNINAMLNGEQTMTIPLKSRVPARDKKRVRKGKQNGKATAAKVDKKPATNAKAGGGKTKKKYDAMP